MEWAEQSLQSSDLTADDQQGIEEVRKWHFGQSKLVEHCLTQPGADMLAHVGTAATTRDLLAMADAFDGPGSPVNFWGMSYGTLVGAHLLQSAYVPSPPYLGNTNAYLQCFLRYAMRLMQIPSKLIPLL